MDKTRASERRQRTHAAKSDGVMMRQRASLERLAARAGITRQQLEAFTERDTAADHDHFVAQNSAVADRFGSFAGLSKQDFAEFIADKS